VHGASEEVVLVAAAARDDESGLRDDVVMRRAGHIITFTAPGSAIMTMLVHTG